MRKSNMSKLTKLFRVTERIPKIGRFITGYRKLKEANQICSHFSTYLGPMIAVTTEQKEHVFRIRHNVYCEELNFENIRDNGLETDEFDDFSQYCLIHHNSSNRFAGTVRLVTPSNEGELLPIEKYCLDSITNNELDPRKFDRNEVCEISRLAVPHEFRRRQMDQFAGAATGAINTKTYSENELRCFPFIAIGLYFSAAALAMKQGIKHAYVMMEPRLARSMRFIGIKFEQIGPVIDYHGRRAPYYINQELLLKNLTPGFAVMLKHIQKSIQDMDIHVENDEGDYGSRKN